MNWVVKLFVGDAVEKSKRMEIEHKKNQGRLDDLSKMANDISSQDFELKALYKITDSILSTSADGFLVLDESENIVFINPASEKMFGIIFNEVKGLHVSKFIFIPSEDGKDREPFSTALSNGIERTGGVKCSYQDEVCGDKGKSFHADIVVSPVKNGISGYIVSIRDVEEEFNEKDRTILVVDQVIDMIYCPAIVVNCGIIKYANKSGYDFLRGPKSNVELVGMDIDVFFKPIIAWGGETIVFSCNTSPISGPSCDIEITTLCINIKGEQSELYVLKTQR